MAGDWLLEVRGLCKSFGKRPVLRDVNLAVQPGESLAIFGPNGAGKTTLLRVLATLSRPSAGAIRYLGVEMGAWGVEVRQHVGLVAHKTFLHQDLTAEENLLFYGRMYGVAGLRERVGRVLERFAMIYWRHRLVRELSRGMQQRLSIARAILHEPILLLLDEPYTGLDPQAAAFLETLLEEWTSQGRGVILTSHDLERGMRGCDQFAILDSGRIVHKGARDAWEGQALYGRYVGRKGL